MRDKSPQGRPPGRRDRPPPRTLTYPRPGEMPSGMGQSAVPPPITAVEDRTVIARGPHHRPGWVMSSASPTLSAIPAPGRTGDGQVGRREVIWAPGPGEDVVDRGVPVGRPGHVTDGERPIGQGPERQTRAVWMWKRSVLDAVPLAGHPASLSSPAAPPAPPPCWATCSDALLERPVPRTALQTGRPRNMTETSGG